MRSLKSTRKVWIKTFKVLAAKGPLTCHKAGAGAELSFNLQLGQTLRLLYGRECGQNLILLRLEQGRGFVLTVSFGSEDNRISADGSSSI